MSKDQLTWVLVGAPNSGKTSLFNELTGQLKEVMNYPGSTVVSHKGRLQERLGSIDTMIVDTPGVYGLFDDSLETQELLNVVAKNEHAKLIYVVDVRFFDHRKSLMLEVLKLGKPSVVFCTHTESSSVNLEVLNKEYAVPFVNANDPLSLKILLYALKNLNHAPAITVKKEKSLSFEEVARLDAVLLHPIWGGVFALLMLLVLFNSVFYIATPISNLIEYTMDSVLQNLGYLSPNMWVSLLSGMILGLGTLLMFSPQIFMLFFVIFFIQESGYLARLVVIFDVLFQRFGLSGRSFVSILSGFSCAVPAILLTRTIESKRERLLTMIAIPFLVCSARVPMLAMCVSFLFYQRPVLGGIVFSICYFLSLLLGLLAAAVISKIVPDDVSSSLIMEIPPYQPPRIFQVVRMAFVRLKSFFREAGVLIFTMSFIIWGVTSFPLDKQSSPSTLSNSYVAKVGKFLDPVFQPMGADWRVGTSVLASFAAREVFVPSLTMLLGQELSNFNGKSVFTSFQDIERSDGTKLFSGATVIALLMFFMIALQCSSTSVVMAKESGSWRIALAQFALMNGLAYIASVCVYQLLKGVF